MRGARGVVVAACIVVVALAVPAPAMACSEVATDLDAALTDGLPVVEQQVVASSLPLLPFSGRSSRVTVRTWGDLRGMQVPTRLDFAMLDWAGCRSPIEEWIGDRRVFQVSDSAGFVELVPVTDVAGGLTDEQADALTAALGEPAVASPTPWDRVAATVWAWWPHVVALALVVGYLAVMLRLLRRLARAVARRREAREAAAG